MIDTEQNMKEITEYLEQSLCGARMTNDEEVVLRLSRAIAALHMDVEMDIFTEEAVEKYVQKQVEIK